MSCSNNKITYPKDDCPKIDDSKQLLYNGPALSCINVQTNNPLNDILKKINDLFCKDCTFTADGTITIGSCESGVVNITVVQPPTTTTTSTTTQAPPPSICWIGADESGTKSYIDNFTIGISPAAYNGKVWYGSSTGNCVYWDDVTNKWSVSVSGLGGTVYQTLDNNNNAYPISDLTYQWTPECLTIPPFTFVCSSEATTCPENICFGVYSESSGPDLLLSNEFPQSSLINGKVWYKGQITDFNNDYYYIYWDNTNTYVTGGTWVCGVSANGSLTPPLSPTDVWYYSGTTGNYPSDCESGCIPTTPWNPTQENPDDQILFAVTNRGDCPINP